jgi:hypothetical protein
MRAALGAALVVLVGCAAPEKPPAAQDAPDLDAELARARASGRALVVVVYEAKRSRADDVASSLFAFESPARVSGVRLDLAVSRSRAVAARFHLVDAPILLCLSPQGVILSRDEKDLTHDLLARRLDEAEHTAAEIDARLETLEAAASTNAESRMKLADFFLAHQNAREAIPHLRAVADDAGAELAVRVRAWVDEARAHFWTGEPEKGRHTAEALIATLGASAPEAKAGGYYALGAQDVKGRHRDLGLRELDQAIAAAPDSFYGQRAREERAKFDGGGH